MLIALLALFVGGVLLYAGVKNLSVAKLLVGDNQTPPPNPKASLLS